MTAHDSNPQRRALWLDPEHDPRERDELEPGEPAPCATTSTATG